MKREILMTAITAGLAMLGWILATVAERLSDTPYLVYEIDEKSCLQPSAGCVANVIIENITRSQAYLNVELIFSAEDGEAVRLDVIPIGVSSEGSFSPEPNGTSATSVIPLWGPGASYKFQFQYKNSKIFNFRILSQNNDAIYITERNIETTIVKYEIYVLVIVFSIFVAFMMFSGFVIFREQIRQSASRAYMIQNRDRSQDEVAG